MRRQLIDQITSVLPNCTIFKNKSIFPHRNFDDLMIQDKGLASKVASINTVEELKDLKKEVSKLKTSGGFFHLNEDSTSNIGTTSPAEHNNYKQLSHSPTQQPTPIGSILPELPKAIKNPKNFMFGIKNYDEISEIQRFEPQNARSSKLETEGNKPIKG